MWSRILKAAPILALTCAGAVAGAAAATASPPADAKFKLKPGARGPACVGCHTDFEDKLKLPAVHTPVRNGRCTDCHSPHASDHGRLLAEPPSAICVSCHAATVPADAKSVHGALEGGQCGACHDPHASQLKNGLTRAGTELCVSCHKELGDQIAKNTFKHPPVGTGCVSCHDPHASTKEAHLLTMTETALCTSCHRPDQPAFGKAHLGYPVTKGSCSSCHDPHGSSTQAMLWNSVHKPVASRSCGQCHNPAGSPDALEPKKKGLDGCRSCHSELVNAIFAAKRLHDPAVDAVACLNCHGPHATKQPKLIKAPMKAVCGSCHADTIRRQTLSVTKHPPIDDGDCTSCHQPHASDFAFLSTAATQTELCGSCHDWQQHQGHPIGPKAIDPRNKNLAVDCESCHRTHGTPFPHFTHADSKADLCVQCHETYRR